jgi:hypothetical protein
MGGRENQRGRRMVRLPELIRIEQTAGGLSIADSAGLPIEQITTAKTPAVVPGGGVPVFTGEWKKDQLHITREGPRGKITETFFLEEDGGALVIQTKMDPSGQRPAREFKRIYRRVST